MYPLASTVPATYAAIMNMHISKGLYVASTDSGLPQEMSLATNGLVRDHWTRS